MTMTGMFKTVDSAPNGRDLIESLPSERATAIRRSARAAQESWDTTYGNTPGENQAVQDAVIAVLSAMDANSPAFAEYFRKP